MSNSLKYSYPELPKEESPVIAHGPKPMPEDTISSSEEDEFIGQFTSNEEYLKAQNDYSLAVKEGNH